MSSSLSHRAIRLAPGTSVFRLPDRLVIHVGGDDFLELDLPEPQQLELAAILEGTRDPTAGTLPDDLLAGLLAELTEEGVILGGGATDVLPAAHTAAFGEAATALLSPARALVLGEGPIAESVGGLLAASGVVTDSAPDASLTAIAADVVVACAGWLPDAEWCRLDARFAAQGVAWHRCHGDGTAFQLGPLTVPGGPGYRDTRARRLAATDVPELLLGLWRHLDERPTEPFRWPHPGAVAVIAGILASDVLAQLRGEPTPATTAQRELRLADLRQSLHPVLAVPDPELVFG